MKGRSRLSRAQFIVLFTLALPIIIGAVGLGADFAILYLNWTDLQKAADSAALAGAEYLLANPVPPAPPPTAASCPSFTGGDTTNDPKSVSCTYSVLNGAQASEWAANLGSLPTGDPTIQVILDRPQVPTYFLRLVGVSSLAAKAQATAVGPQPVGCTPIFPVAIQCNTSPCNFAGIDPGQAGGVTFGSKFVGGLAPGNWDWANVGQGTGANELATAIQDGSNSPFCVSNTVSTSPGYKANSGVVQNGLSKLLATCAAATTTVQDPCSNGGKVGGTGQVPLGDPCLVTMPAVNFNGCTGACTMAITGFAEIYLEQNSTASNINGCFVQALDFPGNTGGGGGSDLGALAPPHLIN